MSKGEGSNYKDCVVINMDPLISIEEDVWWLIFQHFTVRDIIKTSQVSALWSEAIGDSRICMNKVWLRFYWPLDNVDSLINSKRKYRNFKVQRGLLPPLIPVYKKYRWVQVMMRDDCEMDSKNYIQFMKELAPTIEELELWNLSTKITSTQDFDPIEFPVLRKLEWRDTSRQLLTVFLGNNPRLHAVNYEGGNVRSNNENPTELKVILRNILENMQS